MQKLWKRLFAGRHNEADDSAKALQGGIELITPSLIAGWVHHPGCSLSDVRLLAGPHLIAQARIDHHRADVEDHLQLNGQFGFELEIPADLPLLRMEAAPIVLAFSADGSQRFPLSCLGARSTTQERLTAALQPEMRGLLGHFDGLSPDGTHLLGWCYKVGGREPAQVWLQSTHLAPRPLMCDQYRPGMVNQGHRDICGFSLALSDWPEAAGSQVWVTFDRSGVLRLPQARLVELPPLSDSMPVLLVHDQPSSVAIEPKAGELVPYSDDASEHWQALDSFRRYLDGLEQELDRHDQIQLRPRRQNQKGLWARLLGPGR